MSAPFWETKKLEEMSAAEWESVCDGCAKCCLVKLEDEDTGEIAYTRLHCRLLDAKTCRCSDYANRQTHVPDCVALTPGKIDELRWMPESCAYKRLAEGRGLPDWHHLISGDRQAVHTLGHSIIGETHNEADVPEEDWEEFINSAWGE